MSKTGMKFKATKKEIVNGYYRTIETGYCEMQYLLNYRSPVAYTCGVYGWNADIYDISDIVPNTCIVTGYRPFGNSEINHSTIRETEKEAEKIVCNWNIPYDEKKAQIESLLCRLVPFAYFNKD